MALKLKIDPVLRITAILILLSCLCLPGQKADAFRQNYPQAINPQPGPPPQIAQALSFYKLASREIINTFKESGLEVVNIQTGITMGPSNAEETTIFLIPSAGENIGGLIASYSSQQALEKDRKYYSEMNKPSAAPSWRIFQRENILLLISGKVPEVKALLYKETLEGM